MSGITFLKQNPSKLGWDSPIRKMVCGLSFLLWLALLQTSLAVNVPGPNGTVVTQILSATSSNPEVKVVEDRDLGKILVYPPQPKEFTVKIIARIMYPDDQYLEKISTVMVGGAGVTIESSEIRNSLILATLKVAPGASGGRFSITYENEDNSNHKGCNVRLLPMEIVELSPKVKDEDNNDIAGSEKPNTGKPLTPFVEVDPHANRIAHRELKVKIGEALKGKKVTWTLEVLPGATPATIRGEWEDSPTHKDRFEASAAYGANGFRKISQQSGETTIADDGHTAIRVNAPPIGFNQVRIKIQIEGVDTAIDLIDMEVPGIVVIDPGHGGVDSGAVGDSKGSKIEEADLALAYGLDLNRDTIAKFKAEKRNFKVFMTRDKDVKIENHLRAQLARTKGADVFVSVHFNAASKKVNGRYVPNPVPRGTEYVTRSTGQVNATEDAQLGASVQGVTLAAVRASDSGGKHRSPKSGGFAVLSDTHYGNTANYHPIRGTIIEVEFLTNATALESVKLSTDSGKAIKTKFSKDSADVIYNNMLNHQ